VPFSINKSAFLSKLLILVFAVITANLSFADTLMLSGDSVSGDWHQGLYFTAVNFGPVTINPDASTGPVLVGYVTADPSQWFLGEEDFWTVGVHYTVNGVSQPQGTLFESEPEVICLTASCSDSTPDEWGIDSYLAPGAIYTSSGEIVASPSGQGAFDSGGILIPASNGTQVYPLYYSFSLIPEPASVTLLFAGIGAMMTIRLRKRLTLSAKTTVR
jgi:hypothetical protein